MRILVVVLICSFYSHHYASLSPQGVYFIMLFLTSRVNFLAKLVTKTCKTIDYFGNFIANLKGKVFPFFLLLLFFYLFFWLEGRFLYGMRVPWYLENLIFRYFFQTQCGKCGSYKNLRDDSKFPSISFKYHMPSTNV